MAVNSKKIETNKYELEIKVDAEKFNTGVQNAYRKNINKINVPGFRKGKAPLKMVEKLYGEGVFFEDAINELYPVALEQAISEAGLEVVARPEVEMVEVNKENGFCFKAICVVKPEVEIKDYKGIKIEKNVKAVTDEDINSELSKKQEKNSRLVSIEDRSAKMDDACDIDFDGYLDGVQFPGGKAEGFSLTLGSGQFISGFEEQIVGKNIGEEFDVNVSFPEEYHEKSLAGKPTVFKVKLNGIKAKEVAELDDEFAKDVSEFETLEELKADIKAKLEEANTKQAEIETENKLVDAVVENMTAEIPVEMFEAQIDEQVRGLEQKLMQQGMKLDLYLQYTGMDMESLRKTFEEQAKKQVKVRLALDKIVEIEKIEASEQELNDEYQKIADTYKMKAEEIKNFVPAQELKKDICANKAIDLIKSTAEITEAAPKKKTTKKAKEQDKE